MQEADADRRSFEALADSVSDGRAVDWAGAEGGALDAGEQARLRALREVERIAAFHRELQRSDAPAAGEPAGGRWGELLLLERLAAGASGEVWRAWDARLRREVALKFLQPRAGGAPGAEALLEEARALARVRHPGVVAVHGCETHEGRAGMWMEYLAGETLAAAVERRGALPPAEVARIGAAIARALGAVHAAGLVHRDVKPANVLLASGGRAALTDFGLGQRLAPGASEPLGVSGTPMFMAPERLAGGPATPRTDVYALGMTLWLALAGAPPFSARSVAELVAAARLGPVPPLALRRPDAPRALVAAIGRAIAPDPGARFGSADELAAALEAAGAPVAGAPPGRHASRNAAIAAVAIALVIAAAAWLAPRLRPGAPSRRDATQADTPGAPPAYDVEATLVRRSGGGYRRLATGDRVAPGDRLSLEFRASRRAWVYVLNEDERGASFLLFPQPLFDARNPIPAESSIVLPGPIAGRENAWTVTSRGGREHFLVIASSAPVPEIEAELSRLPAAEPGRAIEYAAIPAPAIDRLRGVGGVAPLAGDAAPRRAGTFERFAALAGRETGVRGVWVRELTLENPLR